MADTFTAVFDACVLYPFYLRDVLVQLSTTDLFRGRWSESIHNEWMTAAIRETKCSPERLQRTKELMDSEARDCLVTGYEPLIDALRLPDPNDRHVLAAAIKCSAQVIVTKNLKHFPVSVLEPWGIEPQHPDDFVSCLLDLNPGVVCASLKVIRSRYKFPAMTVEEYLETLRRQELVTTVADLRPFAELL